VVITAIDRNNLPAAAAEAAKGRQTRHVDQYGGFSVQLYLLFLREQQKKLLDFLSIPGSQF
jgi:hypothetical protein